MKILHIVPDSINVPNLYYLGSTKDIWGRFEYFETRSLTVEQLPTERSDDALLERLAAMPLAEYATVFIELPIYPKSMAYIRSASPDTKVYCRSINAELYHQFDSFVSNYLHQRRNGTNAQGSFSRHFSALKGVYFRLKQDYMCGNLSDALLSITDWEMRNYWRYLVGGKARTLPYFLPAKYEQEIAAQAKPARENICIAFMSVSVGAGSTLADSLYNFAGLVGRLNGDLPEWSFAITSDTREISSDIAIPERVWLTGFLETPYPLLARSRAVAILSPYGHGFKTKILEAILSGCYVMVPPRLKRRLPAAVRPFCIEVNVRSVESFKRALSRCLEPFPASNPNEDLKAQAYCALDELFPRR